MELADGFPVMPVNGRLIHPSTGIFEPVDESLDLLVHPEAG